MSITDEQLAEIISLLQDVGVEVYGRAAEDLEVRIGKLTEELQKKACSMTTVELEEKYTKLLDRNNKLQEAALTLIDLGLEYDYGNTDLYRVINIIKYGDADEHP